MFLVECDQLLILNWLTLVLFYFRNHRTLHKLISTDDIFLYWLHTGVICRLPPPVTCQIKVASHAWKTYFSNNFQTKPILFSSPFVEFCVYISNLTLCLFHFCFFIVRQTNKVIKRFLIATIFFVKLNIFWRNCRDSNTFVGDCMTENNNFWNSKKIPKKPSCAFKRKGELSHYS